MTIAFSHRAPSSIKIAPSLYAEASCTVVSKALIAGNLS
jgi:hypothetical protein